MLGESIQGRFSRKNEGAPVCALTESGCLHKTRDLVYSRPVSAISLSTLNQTHLITELTFSHILNLPCSKQGPSEKISSLSSCFAG